MLHRQMRAIGWRTCMEPGQAFGTYAPTPASGKHIDECFSNLALVFMGNRFSNVLSLELPQTVQA
ncbi:hypothetical protein FN846DRAFT_911586 [Sphaerosporella brunnea]|uniref:Uncharacterized protein n=1 Tax=Sphaerosporella brunnea TaxID=1250544 RepID=A0A5J5EKL5_9PEZI|nr:hypothetical protein FN846DRAFT_911586 [Sphaerosporella brunnea]